jgi:hypothetical protein
MSEELIPVTHLTCGKPAFWTTTRMGRKAPVNPEHVRLADGSTPSHRPTRCESCGEPIGPFQLHPEGGFADD